MTKWRIVMDGDNDEQLEDVKEALEADGWAFADAPDQAGFRIERPDN